MHECACFERPQRLGGFRNRAKPSFGRKGGYFDEGLVSLEGFGRHRTISQSCSNELGGPCPIAATPKWRALLRSTAILSLSGKLETNEMVKVSREARHTLRAAMTAFLLLAGDRGLAVEDMRAALGVPGDETVLTLHASGVQIYECRANASGALEWAFKAPQADLFLAGEQVGRHYAGPTWEYRDGSRITGTVLIKVDPADSRNIPWLRLAVASHAGDGAFSTVGFVLRIDTQGGAPEGSCREVGATMNAPYQANYVFVRRP
ncbi:MAG: DUF3455 domain-containing protein [Beijerinckiaceae bacterium]